MLFTEDYYHVYNRGAHKAPIFQDESDYIRFLHLLYVANSEKPFLMHLIKPEDIFTMDCRPRLVEILAYCLMPNHFHIAIKEIQKSGTAKFIKKLCTGYSMYYNVKYKHSGTIFQGSYKVKPVMDQEYLQILINYIHLNPFGLKEPILVKEAHKDFMEKAVEYSKQYEYSSLKDYIGVARAQKLILNRSDLFRSDLY